MRMGLLVRRTAAAVLVVAVGACARPPTLGSVLKDRYPGYQQVLPATSVSLSDRNYEFVPGTVVSAVELRPASRNEAALWQADPIYRPPGYPLSDVSWRDRSSTRVTYNFDLSLRRVLHLRKARPTSISRRTRSRSSGALRSGSTFLITYSIRGHAPVPRHVKACIDAIIKRPGIQKIRSIIVGNVHVDVLFKYNASVIAKWSVANKINSSLGFGFLKGESYTISGDNLVFGADLVRVRN